MLYLLLSAKSLFSLGPVQFLKTKVSNGTALDGSISKYIHGGSDYHLT